MVLNSNRKNVAKIAAASSFAFLSLSPSYQLNNVEDGLLVMENIRDGLKSNIYGLNFLGAVKRKFLLPTWNFVKSRTVKSVTSLYKGCSNLLQSQRSKQPVDNHIEKQNLLKTYSLDLLPIGKLKRPVGKPGKKSNTRRPAKKVDVDKPEKHLLPIGKLKRPVGNLEKISDTRMPAKKVDVDKPEKHLLPIEPLQRPVDEPEEILVPENVKEAIDRFEKILETRRAANKVDVDESEKISDTRIPVKIDVDETEKILETEPEYNFETIHSPIVQIKKAVNKIEKLSDAEPEYNFETVLEEIRVMIEHGSLAKNVKAGSEIWVYFCNQCVSNPGIFTNRLTNDEAIKVIETIGKYNEPEHLEAILKGTDPNDPSSQFIFEFVKTDLIEHVMDQITNCITQLVNPGECQEPLRPCHHLQAPLEHRRQLAPSEIPTRLYGMMKIIRDNITFEDRIHVEEEWNYWLQYLEYLAGSSETASRIVKHVNDIFK